MSVLVLDNTVLSHFARANELEVLEQLVDGARCVVPAQVSLELVAGIAQYRALGKIVGLQWLDVVELTEIQEIVAFARYKAEFGGGVDRNNGEAAVLAWAAVNGGTAIIDERVATRAAQRDAIEVHGTLWLITNGVRLNLLDRSSAERMVDQLAATDMKLPTDGAGLFDWAFNLGLLP